MRSRYQVTLVLFIFSTATFAGDWIEYTNETASRLIADASLGAKDTKEKDYAWGDVDRDGDIDLVVVRKEINTNSIGYQNVLFMLEGRDDGQAINGVLVDRTTEYIPQFLDITNDRDVALVDLDGDQQFNFSSILKYIEKNYENVMTDKKMVEIKKGLDSFE